MRQPPVYTGGTMPDTQPDPCAGHGGSYILDPKTGQRRLVERTQEAAPPAAETTTAPADDGQALKD